MSNKVDLKVVLLGKEVSGKTSLVERFIHKSFVFKKQQPTIGGVFDSKTIKIKSKSVIFEIWNTAGSEKYESLSRHYYRSAKAAIVCFDLSDDSSFSRAKYWISELRKNEETCKIYLCGTKYDLIESEPNLRRVDYKTALNYGKAIEAYYTETSSKTGLGIEELFHRIALDYTEFQMTLEEPTINLSYDERKKGFCCF